MTRPRMTITVRGTTYPSAQSAAAALGVSPATVYCALARGNLDRLGLGPDYANMRHGGGVPKKPVIVAGRKFDSLAALARALDRDPKNLRASLKRGEQAKARIVLAVMKIIAAEDMAEKRRREKLLNF